MLLYSRNPKSIYHSLVNLTWKNGKTKMEGWKKKDGKKMKGIRYYSTNEGIRARSLIYDSLGKALSVLKEVEQKLPEVGSGQVLVKILAAPIHPADISLIEGTYGSVHNWKPPTFPVVAGIEGSGVVLSVGSGVKNISVNDQVIFANGNLGTWRTHGIFDAKDLIVVPKDIRPEYAALSSIAPITAIRLLEDFVSLEKGDCIIQNGASGSVGMSVLQIAHQRGIKTINILRDKPEIEILMDKLKDHGGDVVVTESYAKNIAFQKLISDLPKPKLALNCIGGSSATELIRNLDTNGVHVTYGAMSKRPTKIPSSYLIFDNIQLRGFWLSRWQKQTSRENLEKTLEVVFDLIRSQKLELSLELWDINRYKLALERHMDPYKRRKIVLVSPELIK